jgi:hypothetical protein
MRNFGFFRYLASFCMLQRIVTFLVVPQKMLCKYPKTHFSVYRASETETETLGQRICRNSLHTQPQIKGNRLKQTSAPKETSSRSARLGSKNLLLLRWPFVQAKTAAQGALSFLPQLWLCPSNITEKETLANCH